jgi:hypothetical protein
MGKITREIFAEGRVCTILGLPEAGKTNIAIILAGRAVESGFHVWTNIHFFDFEEIEEAIREGRLPPGIDYRKTPPEIHTITKLSQLLLGLLEHKKNLVILDEAAIFASSTSPMEKRTKTIKNLTNIIRHFRSSIIFITQIKGAVAPALREGMTNFEMKITKLGRGKTSPRLFSIGHRIEVNDEETGEVDITFAHTDTWRNVPLCQFPVDSYFTPGFELDIDLEEALNKLANLGNSLKVDKGGREVILQLIEKGSKESISNGESIIKKLIFSEFDSDKTLTAREIARKYKTTEGYVNKLKGLWINKKLPTPS